MARYRDDMQAAMERAEHLASEKEALEQEAEALARENAELRVRVATFENAHATAPVQEARTRAAARPSARVLIMAILAPAGLMAGAIVAGVMLTRAPTPTRPDDGSVQQVVSGHTADLKRACWTTSSAAPTKVKARLDIDGSGRVTRVTTEGADGALDACVRDQTARWRFPRSKEGTTVNVPFDFVRK